MHGVPRVEEDIALDAQKVLLDLVVLVRLGLLVPAEDRDLRVELRAALRQLMSAEMDSSSSDAFIEDARENLNRVYDAHVAKWGTLNRRRESDVKTNFLGQDPEYAGVQALGRQGVNVSSGWQLDTAIKYNSAGASTKQITLDHTHYETIEGVAAATELYGNVFKPTVHNEVYKFEDLPRAMAEMNQAVQTGIPIVRVAEDMPAAVKSLL